MSTASEVERYFARTEELQKVADQQTFYCKKPRVRVCIQCGKPFSPEDKHPSQQHSVCGCTFMGDPYPGIEVDYPYHKRYPTLGERLYILNECVYKNNLCDQSSNKFKQYVSRLDEDVAAYNAAHSDEPVAQIPPRANDYLAIPEIPPKEEFLKPGSNYSYLCPQCMSSDLSVSGTDNQKFYTCRRCNHTFTVGF